MREHQIHCRIRYVDFISNSKQQNDMWFRWAHAWRHRIAYAFSYLDFRRNNLCLTFRLLASLSVFANRIGVSFNLTFLLWLILVGFCTANNFSSRFECFFVPVRFWRKHNITLRVIAQCTDGHVFRAYTERAVATLWLSISFSSWICSVYFYYYYHTLNYWMHFTMQKHTSNVSRCLVAHAAINTQLKPRTEWRATKEWTRNRLYAQLNAGTHTHTHSLTIDTSSRRAQFIHFLVDDWSNTGDGLHFEWNGISTPNRMQFLIVLIVFKNVYFIVRFNYFGGIKVTR